MSMQFLIFKLIWLRYIHKQCFQKYSGEIQLLIFWLLEHIFDIMIVIIWVGTEFFV